MSRVPSEEEWTKSGNTVALAAGVFSPPADGAMYPPLPAGAVTTIVVCDACWIEIDAARFKGHACPALASAVDHPAHYGGEDNPYEAIKVIEVWELNFHRGQVVKYVARAGRKDPAKELEDLKKAAWYLNREIEKMEKSR